jgi:hypothetical protein
VRLAQREWEQRAAAQMEKLFVASKAAEHVALGADWPQPRHWQPSDPHLYSATIQRPQDPLAPAAGLGYLGTDAEREPADAPSPDRRLAGRRLQHAAVLALGVLAVTEASGSGVRPRRDNVPAIFSHHGLEASDPSTLLFSLANSASKTAKRFSNCEGVISWASPNNYLVQSATVSIPGHVAFNHSRIAGVQE